MANPSDYERMRIEADSRRRADLALRRVSDASFSEDAYKWGGSPIHFVPTNMFDGQSAFTRLIVARFGAVADNFPLKLTTLSLADMAGKQPRAGLPASRLIEDFEFWPPPERYYEHAAKIYAAGGPVDHTIIHSYNVVHREIAQRMVAAGQNPRRDTPSATVQKFLVALANYPSVAGWKIRVPERGLGTQIREFATAVARAFNELRALIEDLQAGDLTSALGDAQAAGAKLSGTERARLRRAGEIGWFGPPPALWVRTDQTLWDLLRDLEL